jgi:hypothetical protein
LQCYSRRGLLQSPLASAGVAILPFEPPGWERINGLVGVASDLRFEVSQTGGDPAWQAGSAIAQLRCVRRRLDQPRRLGPFLGSELEIDYVAGFGRDLHRDWWGEIALRRYTYPQLPDPLGYDYTEIGGMLRFRDLVTLSVAYSPDWSGYTSLGAVHSEQLLATEVGLQYPLRYGFSATGGLGRLEITGQWGGTSHYWNAGFAHQYDRLTVDLSYYDTDSSAQRLFGPTSVQGEVVAATQF